MDMPSFFILTRRPKYRSYLERVARGILVGPEPGANGILHIMHTLSQRRNSRYNSQGPFTKAVEELPPVLAFFVRLLLTICGNLRIVFHVSPSL